MSLLADVRLRRGALELRVRLEALAGQPLVLLGPNGAGKSTLLEVLAGLLRPQAGRVELDGQVLDDDSHHVPPSRRPVGLLPQDRLLFEHLSALENVAFPLRARGVSRRAARARAAELLERFGVAGRAGARPSELSGGEAQRVALARALVARPRLLLLDEPLSALDASSRARARELLGQALREVSGIAVVVTHDPVEAMTLGARLALMEGGRLTQEGTPEQVRTAPRTPYAAELVGVNLLAGELLSAGEGVGVLRTPEGEVVVALPPGTAPPAREVLAVLSPADVALHAERPETSARNVLRGRVTSVWTESGRARVRLSTRPPLVAEVTAGSARRLGLREGVEVWASFKAAEVRLLVG